MSQWPSAKAKRIFVALLGIGWKLKRQSGSHRTLSRAGWPDFVFAFHDGEEIGPRMLARISKHTGLKPGDL
ncbi:type II toxin-antitoxin system HicA family toxin [Acidithiobacillus concretivorus]|uniref:Addiction module toxin, HicA family n=1 Tax=Acidithiobacillus concretivorus TaxID=3063952 RepID=A0ABS5ZN56_9PROT|nr:type II toxin-antitoxin system HicA family toxin [Acidithiobacillus concretivorus]MBU2738055.1 addiction module toxin, HicA family [Acidithiobacillus concretivorus]